MNLPQKTSDGVAGGIILGVVFSALLIIFAFSIFTSQPPVPANAKKGSNPQKEAATADGKTTNDKAGAKDGTPASNADEASPQNRPDGNNPNPQDDKSTLDWYTLANAVAVSVFTFFLVIVAILQWRTMDQQGRYLHDEMLATRDAAKAAIDTVAHMQLDMRPWLWCEAPDVERLVPGLKTKCKTKYRNLGRTPCAITRSTTCTIYIEMDDKWFETCANAVVGLRRDMAKNRPPVFNMIPPGGPHAEGEHQLNTERITVDAMEQIRTGEARLYLIEMVEYVDMFQGGHFTQASFVYNHAASRFLHNCDWNEMT